MYDILEHTVEYFRTGRGSMWQWSADGEVAEFRRGDTITYREELVLLLQYFTEEGLPPLPSVLYILYACLDVPGGMEQAEPYRILDAWKPIAGPRVTGLMQVVQGLPAEWRTGARKGLLLQEIFRGEKPVIPAEHARAVLDEFRSGRLNDRVSSDRGALLTMADLNNKALHAAAERFPTTESLLIRLRTGLDAVPDEAPVAPELPADDLLRQLLSDPKTEGVARLTQRLVAALHITMHTAAVGNLPLGGYADISTRGDFDRLLLSELAYDDALLTARLVNNEALYLRREEPPDQVQRQRIILLDTTLPMWGLPRVFAVAAALASTRNLPLHTTAQVVALGGETHTLQNLSHRAGIVHALELLDGALHCGAALENVVRRGGFDDDADYLLITDEETLHDPDFEVRFRITRERLQFLITVSRHGALHFYALRNGRRKLLNSANYDLDDLVMKRPNAAPPVSRSHESVAFLQIQPAPLYFPPVGMPSTASMAYQTDTAVFCVTEHKRLLYWHHRKRGAVELLHYIQGNQFIFYAGEKEFLCMLACDTTARSLHFYRFNLNKVTHISIDLTAHFETSTFFISAGFMMFQGRSGLTGVNCLQARLASDDELLAVIGIKNQEDRLRFSHTPDRYLAPHRYNNNDFSLRRMRHFTNIGSTVLQRITSVDITSDGKLLINGFALFPIPKHVLKLHPRAEHTAGSLLKATPGEPRSMTNNPHVKFYPFYWPRGGRAYGDARGMLHLESDNKAIPAVTILLTVRGSVTCWSADGSACGGPDFTRIRSKNWLGPTAFYDTYIKPFIDDILHHHQSSL
jgi:hypothetical protein